MRGMKREEVLQRQYEMLDSLSKIPLNILRLHGHQNVTDFVLYELCHERCFNLEKAAYFVDNPDFNCLKGVAGHARTERVNIADIWKDTDNVGHALLESPFNKQVRSYSSSSLKKEASDNELACKIAKDLGIKEYGYCSWGSKHDNHGILIYEKAKNDEAVDEERLLSGLSLLSFCPLF